MEITSRALCPVDVLNGQHPGHFLKQLAFKMDYLRKVDAVERLRFNLASEKLGAAQGKS